MNETQPDNVRPLDGTVGGALDQPQTTLDTPSNDEECTREDLLKQHGKAALVKECRKAIDDIKLLELERTATNQKVTAIRGTLESKGISKKALAMAIQVSKFNDDDLDGFNASLTLLLESIDRPLQHDLFGQPQQNADQEAASA